MFLKILAYLGSRGTLTCRVKPSVKWWMWSQNQPQTDPGHTKWGSLHRSCCLTPPYSESYHCIKRDQTLVCPWPSSQKCQNWWQNLYAREFFFLPWCTIMIWRWTHLLNLNEEAVDVISGVGGVQVFLVLLNLFCYELVDFAVDFLQGMMRPRQTSHQPGKGIVELKVVEVRSLVE